VQYAIPAYIGETSPDVTPAMTSSSSLIPALASPCRTRLIPSPRRAIVSRSASPQRRPVAAPSAKAGRAWSKSPFHIQTKAFQVRNQARSGQSPHPSSARSPRANQPSAGAASPRNNSPAPMCTAYLAARIGSS
jgi:hypothetical protein